MESAQPSPAGFGEFLRARRESTAPERVGLPREPGRRVSGLRRSEVARLAGISDDYYVRLEQGRGGQPSERVLVAIGQALRLSEHEFAYLLRLAWTAPALTSALSGPSPVRDDHPDRAAITTLLDLGPPVPAFVVDRNLDVVQTNAHARAVGARALEPGENLVLHLFPPPAEGGDALRADPLWEETARRHLAALRFWSDPGDPRLREILGDLGTRASDFPRLWARYDTSPLERGSLLVLVAGRGVVRLGSVGFSLPGREGLTLVTVLGDEDGALLP